MTQRPLSSLVGRAAALVAVVTLLVRPDLRLLTLTGTGGVGKTTLALHAARAAGDAFPDGAWFVPLAAVTDPDLVFPAVAQALGIDDDRESSPEERLAATLAGKRALLVLDNFEQVADCAPLLVDLLRACPELTALVTSRVRLRVDGEREYPAPPLEVAAEHAWDLEDIAAVESVRLFVERAEAVQPGFALTAANAASVAGICRKLDGLPLAIELAATRIKVLPPQALCDRLDQRLALLTGGNRHLLPRQQTMRNTIAWSYGLLSPAEQGLFRRLSVFAGGFDLDAAQAIGGTDDLNGLAALIDHSLVIRAGGTDAAPRFGMLQTIQEYGREQLRAHGEEDAVRDEHAAWFLALAEREWPRIQGPDAPEVLDRFELDHPNFRAALACVTDWKDAERAVRLVAALWKFWYVHRHIVELRTWPEAVLELPGPTPSARRAEVLYALGSFAMDQRAFADAEARGQECLALSEASGHALQTGMALFLLGNVARNQGQFEVARTTYGRALDALHAVSPFAGFAEHMSGMALSSLGDMAQEQGDPARARALNEQALAVWQGRGDPWGIANATVNLAVVTASTDPIHAGARFREALSSYRALGAETGTWVSLAGLAMIAARLGHVEAGARLLGAAEGIRVTTNIPVFRMIQDDYERAVEVARAALGTARFQNAWEAGAALTADEAFAEAMALELAVTARPRAPFGLSTRELEVLQLIAEGRTDQEIADTLFVSYRTATTHVARVLNKLGVDSRTAAASLAVRQGVV